MKVRFLLQFLFVLIAGQLMFSCNTAKYYEFAATKQAPYKVAKQKAAPEQAKEENLDLSEIALAAAEKEEAKAQEEPVLEASTAPVKVAKKPVALAKVTEEVAAPEKTVTEAEALAMAKERFSNMSKSEKKEFKKELKEVLRQNRGGGANIVEIILAVLVPPLAVFLHEGIGTRFWISIILWILGILPGIIFALLVVTDTI